MSPDTTGGLSPLRLALIAVNAVVAILTIAIVVLAVFLQREASVDFTRRTVATLASTLKQHSLLLLRTTEQGLGAVAHRIEGKGDVGDLSVLLAMDNVQGVALLGPEGAYIASYGDIVPGELHEQALRAKPDRDAGWRVGLPIRLTGADGKLGWALPIRHLLTNGRWLVALISLDELDSFYRSLDLPPTGAVGLVRRDGRLLARVPKTDLGRDVSGSELIQRVVRGDRQTALVSISAIDGITRVAAFDSLDAYPVVAYVAIDTGTVANLWTRSAASLIAAGAILMLAILFLSIAIDSSFRRRRATERQLAESRGLTMAVLNAAADGLLAIDERGEVKAANPAAARMLGFRAADMTGRSVFALLPPGGHPPLLNGGGATRAEVEVPGSEGKPVPVSVVVANIEGGALRVVTLHDRTLELEHTAKVAVLEKMRIVGQLTGGVAHDFNNILTIISLNLEMLGTLIAESPLWEQYAAPALRAAKRGASLTSHLLAFARRQPLAPETIDPNAALKDMKALLERSLGERWRIELYPNAEAWPLLADSAQLETALVNLAINARDAMPGGGRIVMETRNIPVDADYAEKVGELLPGDYVIIAVTDEGTGMTEEVLARAFEPFFTTKPVGKGSGLGLSMVFGFAKQSNGHVTIYSEIGKGTTVKLYLPRALAKDVAETGTATGGDDLPCLRVLVVEDDDDVRDTAVRALRAAGMVTVEATSGENALEMVQRGVDFDLLFTDVVLPQMSGRQLADALAAERPGLRVLYSSGYTENAIVHHGRLDPGVVLLSKPYTHAALRAGIAQVIGGRGQKA